MVGPNQPAISRWSTAASSATVCRSWAASFAAVRAPIPQRSRHGRWPITVIQLLESNWYTTSWFWPGHGQLLGEPGGHLGPLLGVADADRAGQRGVGEHRRPQLVGQPGRIVDPGPDEGLVPPPDLDRVAEAAQYLHHLPRRGVIRGVVGGQEHRVRALAERGPQRHARVHPERPGFIGRGRHHLPTLGRIAGAADHNRQPAELGTSTDLHRRHVLVEVDVQQPPTGIRCRRGHRSQPARSASDPAIQKSPAIRTASAKAARQPGSGSATARFGRKATSLMSFTPAQASQSRR